MIQFSGASDALQRLRAFIADGAPTPAAELPKELYAELLAEFGSIAAARQAAGLPTALPPKRRWSEATVLDELRRLHGLGLRIRDRELKDAGHSGVVEAAQTLCGGLPRARRLARIPVDDVISRPRQPWDEARVVSEIQALHAAQQSIASSKVDPRLYLAARRYFGTWGDAVAAAGLDYDEVRMHASSQPVADLLDRLRALAVERPGLSASQLEAHQLGYMLRRRFPSLAAAVRAAGIARWPRRERSPLPTPGETLRAIELRRATDRSLQRSVISVEDRNLLRAAQRHFGSWQQALAAAGVERA